MVRQIQKSPLKKTKKIFSKESGIVYIKAGFNNTIVTITDSKGAVICWSSAGTCGWKGTRKRTAFAAQTAAQTAVKHCMEQHKLKEAIIMIKGAGAGRETAIKGVLRSGLRITLLRDISGVPHNGCRPPNKRRL